MNRAFSATTRAQNSTRAWLLQSSTLERFALPLFLFLFALVVVTLYNPFTRPLYQDPGIFALLSQLVAQGYTPHLSAFNEQSSLAFFAGGAAMWLGDWFGIHHLLSFRFGSMLIVSSVVVLTYHVGKLFSQSAWVGFLAGLILLGFRGYLLRAAETLEPKSFMLVFGLLALFFLYKRKWFWAGASACAAGLVWQIAWGYLVVALMLAFAQGGATLGERARALGITTAAALGIFGIYFAYFFARNAHVEMLQQTFLAPFVMHNVARKPLDARLFKLAKTFYRGFGAHVVFGVLGASGLLLWFSLNAYAKNARAILLRAFDLLFQNPRTAGTLLVTIGFFGYSFLDFQNYPDWIPLLPFISIFAAWFLVRAFQFLFQRVAVLQSREHAIFVGVAFVLFALSVYYAFDAARKPLRNPWMEQQRVADEINQQIPRDAPVWLIGKAELLFFTQRHNLNKYIYLLGRADAAADAFEPGGFETMFKNAQQQKPALYVVGRFKPGKFSTRAHFELVKRSLKSYRELKHCRVLGPGRFFVPPDQIDKLFPRDSTLCLKR